MSCWKEGAHNLTSTQNASSGSLEGALSSQLSLVAILLLCCCIEHNFELPVRRHVYDQRRGITRPGQTQEPPRGNMKVNIGETERAPVAGRRRHYGVAIPEVDG